MACIQATTQFNFTGENALPQGATWGWSVQLTDYDTGAPIDLTGYTARMQLRERVGSSSVLLELSTSNGRLAIVGATGTITAAVDAVTTAALTFTSAVYDLEIITGAVVTRILQGTVDLSLNVTR